VATGANSNRQAKLNIVLLAQFGNHIELTVLVINENTFRQKPKKRRKSIAIQLANTYFTVFNNQEILYMGSNFLHRSMNQGQTWTAISPDLTKGVKEGNGTISTVSESSMQFGLLYTGSDDGLIHLSKDGGTTETKFLENLPQSLWVSE
jgi:hypothetical protein